MVIAANNVHATVSINSHRQPQQTIGRDFAIDYYCLNLLPKPIVHRVE